jgi:glutathione-specific gamma-glutamylcyclotransferase
MARQRLRQPHPAIPQAAPEIPTLGSQSGMQDDLYRTGVEFDGRLPVAAGQDLWVFGYGSLMWNPGFPHSDQARALIRGYHRRFCISSTRYRGTPEKPGLVLGLAPGGSCWGVAFRIPAAEVRAAVAYLYEREMIGNVYRPSMVPALTDRHGTVRAYTFVCRRDSEGFRGDLQHDSTAAIIAEARGLAGTNRDYLANTVRQLEHLGIPDQRLHDLLARIDAAAAPCATDH